jgi:hypothetical protein
VLVPSNRTVGLVFYWWVKLPSDGFVAALLH